VELFCRGTHCVATRHCLFSRRDAIKRRHLYFSFFWDDFFHEPLLVTGTSRPYLALCWSMVSRSVFFAPRSLPPLLKVYQPGVAQVKLERPFLAAAKAEPETSFEVTLRRAFTSTGHFYLPTLPYRALEIVQPSMSMTWRAAVPPQNKFTFQSNCAHRTNSD